jgi:hypothetical protein
LHGKILFGSDPADFSPGEFNRNNKSLIGDLYSSAKPFRFMLIRIYWCPSVVEISRVKIKNELREPRFAA